MALAPVEKIEIVASLAIKDKLLLRLQEAGAVEIKEVEEELALERVAPFQTLEPLLFRLRQAIRFLSLRKKSSLVEKGLKPRMCLTQAERLNILSQDVEALIAPVENLEAEFREITAEVKALEKEKEVLLPWTELDLDLEELQGTRAVEVFLGRLNRSSLPAVATLEAEGPLWFKPVMVDKKTVYGLFLVYHCLREEVEEKLRNLGVVFIYFPDSLLKEAQPGDKVRELISRLEAKIERLKQKLLLVEEEIKLRAEHLPQLSIALDVWENEQQRINCLSRLGQTEKTVLIQGWVASARLAELQAKLAPLAAEIEVFHSPAAAEEEPPVILSNPTVIQPFQIITQLYGYPRPGTMDPTLPLAPFFFLFVGLCVSEAGYGLLVSLLSLFYLWKVKPRGSVALFGRLMFFLGLATVVLGTLVGGWFGFPIRQLLLIDPLTQPVSFLVLSLALGFIQVWFGTLLNALSRLRKGKNIAGGLTQFGWLILLPSIVIFGLKKISLFAFMALFGSLLVVLFASPKRNPVLRILGGLYGLYDISKYLGDILSYCRLLALGLSTSVIAMVVNTLCATAIKIPVIGWVAAPVVFLGGHLFNLAISFLGGFVHSMRLQFVEFFTKFYESGGRPFRPLAFEGKYVDFR